MRAAAIVIDEAGETPKIYAAREDRRTARSHEKAHEGRREGAVLLLGEPSRDPQDGALEVRDDRHQEHVIVPPLALQRADRVIRRLAWRMVHHEHGEDSQHVEEIIRLDVECSGCQL